MSKENVTYENEFSDYLNEHCKGITYEGIKSNIKQWRLEFNDDVEKMREAMKRFCGHWNFHKLDKNTHLKEYVEREYPSLSKEGIRLKMEEIRKLPLDAKQTITEKEFMPHITFYINGYRPQKFILHVTNHNLFYLLGLVKRDYAEKIGVCAHYNITSNEGEYDSRIPIAVVEDSDKNDTQTILEEAQKAVYGDRQADYGSVSDNFETIAKLWSGVLGIDVTKEQVGLCMVQVKVARQMYKPKRDNLVDGAGYFATLEKMENELLTKNKNK